MAKESTTLEQYFKDEDRRQSKLKREDMELAGIPNERRGAFMAWGLKWGIYDVFDKIWVEYGPLERHHKVTRNMREMWAAYLKRNLN